MIRQTGKTFWTELAIEIMLNPLCHIEGAYSVALFHTRELLAKERNVKNLEMMIFFYHLPEKLVNDKEAKGIAKEILRIEPYNKVALDV